jgi:hypothetical protein
VSDVRRVTRCPLTTICAPDHERILVVDQIHVHDRFLRHVTRKICATF